MWQETFKGSGEWKKVAGLKKPKKPKPVPTDWENALKVCQQCDEYIEPDKQHSRGICDPAIDANHGAACGGCFAWYIKKCEKQNER